MLEPSELFFATIFSIILIMVGYFMYFIPQRYPPEEYKTPHLSYIDRLIPFKPSWVWIYSLAYYPFLLSPILTMQSLQEFYLTCLSYFLMLALQIVIALIYPVKTPDEWREYDTTNSWSRIFLRFVQTIDKGGNCFPSMHVAVAVLTGLHILNNSMEDLGIFSVFVFFAVFAIILSTLFTKQHLFRDIIPAILLAFVVFEVYLYIINTFTLI